MSDEGARLADERARVRAAAVREGGHVWPNGLGYDIDTAEGQWSYMTRADQSWSATFHETGEPTAARRGIGASPFEAQMRAIEAQQHARSEGY